jgi:hypothetical protein
MPKKKSGQPPFEFTYVEELHSLPEQSLEYEVRLHGGFAVDKRSGRGQVYYGMPGCGIMRISPDLTQQDVIELPSELKPLNFHSTKIGEFDGKVRLFLPADGGMKIAIISLEGEVEFVLPKPEFVEYLSDSSPFHPTDTTLVDGELFVADGYGSNYVSIAELKSGKWTRKFGGKAGSPPEHGRFGTAHGMNLTPAGKELAIADRPHSRLELCGFDGRPLSSYALPAGSRPCGIDFAGIGGRFYAVVGSLDDPEEGRPAPIYILDGETYQVLSTIRAKDELGVELAVHLHNVVWHFHDGNTFLVCQAWNPGYYFVLQQVS